MVCALAQAHVGAEATDLRNTTLAVCLLQVGSFSSGMQAFAQVPAGFEQPTKNPPEAGFLLQGSG
jgi:hypothetical protein